MYVCTTCAYLVPAEELIGYSGTGVINDWEPLCRCENQIQVSPEEQQVLLTILLSNPSTGIFKGKL